MRHYKCVAVPLAALCCLISVGAANAQPTAPLNDNYLSSTVIPQAATKSFLPVTYNDTQDTTAATTQADLFNPDQTGANPGGGGAEPISCDGVTYGNTIWYDMHPKISVGVELKASGFLNVIAVYEWSTKTSKLVKSLGCRVSTSASQTNDFVVPYELQRNHAYTVQVGGVQTASGVASGSLAFAATFFPDHDGDGIYDPLDSCPTLAGVSHDGGCPPTLSPQLSYSYTGPAASAVSVTRFEVTSVPGGARVAAVCSCGIRQTATSASRANAVPLSSFVGARIPIGSTIEIWTAKPAAGSGIYKFGAIGAYRRYTLSSTGFGTPIRRCLMPGSMTPRRQCPAGGRAHQ